LMPSLAWSQVPFTFATGTPALASEVNANFAAVAGVEFIGNAFGAITATDTVVRTIDVTVPTAGFLIVTGFGNSTCTAVTSFVAYLQNATTGVSSPTFIDARAAANFQYYSTHFVFSVAAGIHTLNLRSFCTGGGTGSINGAMHAIFMANRY